MKQRAAARLANIIDSSNPIHERLPNQLQRGHYRRSAVSPPLPVRPTRRKPGMPSISKESTIHKNMKGIPRNTEKVAPAHTDPPWRTDKRYATRLTTNPARKGLPKGEAADKHRTRITQLSQDTDYIITYTDGSVMEKEQQNRTGAGWVLYWKGVERRNGSEALGKHAEVHDAEMLALLRGLETAIEFQQAMPEENRKRSKIVLFADNTSSVASITSKKPGSSQPISQKFVETATSFLDENTRASIEVSWVPGHMNIEGNDRADGIAKGATGLDPTTETTTIAELYRLLCDKMKVECVTEWEKKPMTGQYAIAGRTPPSLAGSHAFHTPNRHTLGAVAQARPGHAYFGEYFRTYNTQEPVTCPCGAKLKTREFTSFKRGTLEHGRRRSPKSPARDTLPDKGGNKGPGRVCQEKGKQGVPKAKDPSKPIRTTSCKATRSESPRSKGAERHP